MPQLRAQQEQAATFTLAMIPSVAATMSDGFHVGAP